MKIPRENVVIATKVFGEMAKGPNARGATRHHILDGVKASLARLQLDHIDLYQIHGFDAATPIEETVRALDQLVRHGHVRYVGVSNWAAWQIVKALGIAERLGAARFESLQAPPVDKDRAQRSIEVMSRIAKAHEVSIARIALAWLLHQPQVTSVIVGAKRTEQLSDNLAATAVKLSDAELAQIQQVSVLPPEYPGWMLEMQGKYRRQQIADALGAN